MVSALLGQPWNAVMLPKDPPKSYIITITKTNTPVFKLKACSDDEQSWESSFNYLKRALGVKENQHEFFSEEEFDENFKLWNVDSDRMKQ